MKINLDLTMGAALTNAVDNATLPRHRWYPIKEGFSANLVRTSFTELDLDRRKPAVAVEPFSGSGTTPVECSRMGIACTGYEVNPFLAFVGRTKLRQTDPQRFARSRSLVLQGLERPVKSPLEGISTFCESPDRDRSLFNRSVLRAFTGAWKAIDACPLGQRDLFRLALVRATMDNCNAYPDGKCLRYKRLKSYDVFDAEAVAAKFGEYCAAIEQDLEQDRLESASTVHCRDARKLAMTKQDRFDFCVTSPPYLNSFDYSDVYRPEMFLTGVVTNNQELMQIRLKTVRSHVQANWKAPTKSEFGVLYAKTIKEVQTRVDALWCARIPEMVQAYFEDMEQLLKALAARANPNALLKIAVGTSAYGGIVVPVDLILAEIAEAVGWEMKEVQVVRRLRSSAQLWKHEDSGKNVPALRESIVVLRSPAKK